MKPLDPLPKGCFKLARHDFCYTKHSREPTGPRNCWEGSLRRRNQRSGGTACLADHPAPAEGSPVRIEADYQPWFRRTAFLGIRFPYIYGPTAGSAATRRGCCLYICLPVPRAPTPESRQTDHLYPPPAQRSTAALKSLPRFFTK